MQAIKETEERITRTASGLVAALAAPSQGSAEVCTWRVQMESGNDSPLHVIDKDQVWMPTEGTFSFTVDEETVEVEPGEAVVLPAGKARQFRVLKGTGQALVSMAAGGRVAAVGSDAWKPLPWAQ